MKTKYYWIEKLGIPIRVESGIPHLLLKDINKVLNKEQRKLFHKYYGVQTALCRKDGKIGLYCWDCESIFLRIFEQKLEGTQLYWD